jgi:hypothetical protein
VARSQFAGLAFETFLTMLHSDKIPRMELKVLFSEDPAFVMKRADKFLSSEPSCRTALFLASDTPVSSLVLNCSLRAAERRSNRQIDIRLSFNILRPYGLFSNLTSARYS